MLRKQWRKLTKFNFNWTPVPPVTRNLKMIDGITNDQSYPSKHTFRFLNLDQSFSGKINWNHAAYGKLWTYNLTYFEYLEQAEITVEEGRYLIEDFIASITSIKDGIEPFPTSLRIINWVKFLVKNQLQDAKINQSLYAQVQSLLGQLEYHLLGNHLLENGFALFIAGFYFEDAKILAQAETILRVELEEQILKDGAHFELTPMYHQLMLYRLLDCINLVQQNPGIIKKEWEQELREKAQLMLGWMHKISFNGLQAMPLLNDSTLGIAPSAEALDTYAKALALTMQPVELGESGYRKFQNENYEILVDIGAIGPTYIPGHAHSDSLSFVLYAKDQAIIVDPGISTYEKNQQRTLERSSAYHNSVSIAGQDSSEVWGGFRVGRRAKITALVERDKTEITATHNGYRYLGAQHQRSFHFSDRTITITDKVFGKKISDSCLLLHFSPTENIKVVENKIIGNFVEINFSTPVTLALEDYHFSLGFNKTQNATKVIIGFTQELITTIQLK